MITALTAYVDSRRVGQFTTDGGRIAFTFDDDWRRDARRMELSLSMPKSRQRHEGDAPANYLWNLLPDSEPVLERWGQKFHVSPRNPLALLEHVGMDTAGAVQLSVHDAPTLDATGGTEPISTEDIATHIRQLRDDPEAWLIAGHGDGYFSLAGAQSKFALARTVDGWAVPTGSEASTHIFKPGIRGLDRGDLNEHLSLSAAGRLGLEVAGSVVERFEDETVIVVDRYDRAVGADGMVRRIHQEDMAQAAGIHPSVKYQSQGGPGIERVTQIIRSARGRDRGSAERFFEAVLFNWAALGTDAHAKNYSLLHSASDGPRLAPLYDITTALPYPDINTRKAKLAMSFKKHYLQHEIEPRHIFEEAARSGFDGEWVRAQASRIVEGLADAYSDAASDADLVGGDAEFAARITDAAAERATLLRRELSRADKTVVAGTADARAATSQPRRKTTPASNAGSFAKRRNSPPSGTLG